MYLFISFIRVCRAALISVFFYVEGEINTGTGAHSSSDHASLVQANLQHTNQQTATCNQVNNADHSHKLIFVDQANFTFNHRESTTLSVGELSTKQTSLMPSSEFDKTPRSSFLISKEGEAFVDQQEDLNGIIKKLEKVSSNSIKTYSNGKETSSVVSVVINKPGLSDGAEKKNEDDVFLKKEETGKPFERLVNIEVYVNELQPSNLDTPKMADSRRKSSGVKVGWNHRILAPLKEVSICAVDENHEPQSTQSKPSLALDSERNPSKDRRVSAQCIQNPDPDGEIFRQTRVRNTRKRNSMRELSFKRTNKSKASLKTVRSSSFDLVEHKNEKLKTENGFNENTDASDDFGYFHKIILKDEMLRANSKATQSVSKIPRKRASFSGFRISILNRTCNTSTSHTNSASSKASKQFEIIDNT